MLVSQILNSKSAQGVETVKPELMVSEAAAILSEKRIGSLVVSEDGNVPVGILSERDIVRELGKRGDACLKLKVSDLMTKRIITCSPDDNAVDVLTRMTEGRFRHLPVMEGGRMIGLISIGDAVKARLSELAMEKDALEGMIMGH